jgi:hypothetical protein
MIGNAASAGISRIAEAMPADGLPTPRTRAAKPRAAKASEREQRRDG